MYINIYITYLIKKTATFVALDKQTHKNPHKHVNTHKHTHAYTNTHTHTRIYKHTHTHLQTHKRIYKHTHYYKILVFAFEESNFLKKCF